MKLLKRFPFLFVLMVLLPGGLGTWYYLEVASDQFATEAHFIIQGNEKQSSDMLSALTGIPGGTSSAKDALIIQDFILSKAFLSRADKALNVRKHFTDSGVDQYSRMPSDYSKEDFHEYWLDFINIEHDGMSGISKVSVQAFEPSMAVLLARYIIGESESLVNHLSAEAEKDAVMFAQRELVKAEANLTEARLSILNFRNETLSLDLEKTAEAKVGIVSAMEAELAQQETEFARMSTYLQPNAIQLRILKKQIGAMRQQVETERRRWAPRQNTRNRPLQGAALNEQLAKYEELTVSKTFAERVYEAALIAVEKARIEAQQKHRYLVTIVEPQLPEGAQFPEREWEIIKIWVASFLFWGIFSLFLSSVKDHAGFA